MRGCHNRDTVYKGYYSIILFLMIKLQNCFKSIAQIPLFACCRVNCMGKIQNTCTATTLFFIASSRAPREKDSPVCLREEFAQASRIKLSLYYSRGFVANSVKRTKFTCIHPNLTYFSLVISERMIPMTACQQTRHGVLVTTTQRV